MAEQSKEKNAQKTLFDNIGKKSKVEHNKESEIKPEILPPEKKKIEKPVSEKPKPIKNSTPALMNQNEQATAKQVFDSNDWKAKRNLERLSSDRIQKRDAWMLLKEEYPELSKLTDLSNYVVTLTKAVAKKLDIPISGVDTLGGKPYINKTGLFFKLNKIKKKEFTSKALILPLEMNMDSIPDEMKPVIGFSTDGTAIFQSTIILADGTKYTSHGTANAKYLNKDYGKMSTMVPYVIELAETRSENRCIRKATGVGLCSVEEINEQVDMANNFFKKQDNQQFVDEARDGERVKKVEAIEKALDEQGYNDAKKKSVYAVHGNTNIGLLPVKAIDLIYDSVVKNSTGSKPAGPVKPAEPEPTLNDLMNEAEKIRKKKDISVEGFNKITEAVKEKAKAKNITLAVMKKIVQNLKDYKVDSKKKGADKKDGK